MNVWPSESLSNYVYLSSLYDINPDYANKISSALTFKNDLSPTTNSNFFETVYNATIILQKIADNERQKEEQAINYYKQKLEKYINSKETPEQIKEQLKYQLDQLNDAKNGIKETDISLIKQISIIEQDIKNFERRVWELQNKITGENKGEVFNRFDYRIETDVDNFIRDLGKRQSSTSQKNIKIKEILDKLINKEIRNKFNDIPGLEQAIYAILYVDFSEQLMNNYNLSINQLSMEDLKKHLIEYTDINEKTSGARNNLNTLFQTDIENTLALANDFNSFLGVKFIDNKEIQELKEMQAKIEKIKKEEKDKDKQKALIKEVLKDSHTLKEINERILTYDDQISNIQEKIYTFTFKTEQSHGFMKEFRRVINQLGVNISRNVGTDTIIKIGSFTFSKDEQKENNLLRKTLGDINTILSKGFDEQQKEDLTLENFNSAIKREQKINKDIQETIRKTSSKLQKIKTDLKDSFISYDTLKLYRSYETDTMYDNDFHGRNIQILSALSKLYASPELSGILLPQEAIMPLLLNIGEPTLGKNNKKPLESYLSLFAGLLMFDDISNITDEAFSNIIDEIPNNDIKQLHVYDIGGVFFPISIILDNLIQQINLCLTSMKTLTISTDGTAKAILTPPPSSNYKYSGYTKADWANLANSTISKTKIKIAFLSGFNNYIEKLFNTMNFNNQ